MSRQSYQKSPFIVLFFRENGLRRGLSMMGLFGKSKAADPKEQVNEWCKKIRKERGSYFLIHP
jgi:hypothetical protein